MSRHDQNKALIHNFRMSLYDFTEASLILAIDETFAEDVLLQFPFPFETIRSKNELFSRVYKPLSDAFVGLERRDTIVMAGDSNHESEWVGCCGYYTGSFEKPWLDIQPTGHQVSMRFHEFFRMKGGVVVEMQVVWDIPEVMMQAGAWPLSVSLGREWHVPGPATQDGIVRSHDNGITSQASLNVVADMCTSLGNFAQGGVDAMALETYWHPHCSWYGPAGIGTARGIKGFRNWHQIPFLNALPNRVGDTNKGYLFADANYVGFTAWPGMSMTISQGGWLGIAPANQEITMRSLDFWRVENGYIRENWVLIDLLDVYHQIGVDVLGRMRELNKSRLLNFEH
ncbi:ester cyclase [Marinomonas sp. 15G1-11]|uniref:Ester cyclase n=1 Tax=Marinomonas phaeophyticola TaxID=3004091 RepID=A0ABT4JX22_9GAMM|nr:ester cyclase [Marinomonas sp. 15G1-11]MCZ2722915.1 ester cyclase [Marinomonas sp. 15G1-11]